MSFLIPLNNKIKLQTNLLLYSFTHPPIAMPSVRIKLSSSVLWTNAVNLAQMNAIEAHLALRIESETADFPSVHEEDLDKNVVPFLILHSKAYGQGKARFLSKNVPICKVVYILYINMTAGYNIPAKFSVCYPQCESMLSMIILAQISLQL